MTRRTRGPWFWILGGCACLVAAGAIAVALLVWSGSRMVKRVSEQLEDPELRRAAAERVLGGAGVPTGYESVIGLRIPLVGEFVVLDQTVDDEPRAGAPAARRTFIFLISRIVHRTVRAGSDAGASVFEDVIRQQGFGVDRSERVADGRIALETFSADWIGYRGLLDDGHGPKPGMLALVTIDCPVDDGRGRVGMWLEPDADPVVEPAIEGSVIDPLEIERFLGRIDPCPSAP